MAVSISLTGFFAQNRRGAAVRHAPTSYLGVWKQRRELAQLSPARLRDLGITPAQAAQEAARPFWDLP